MRHAQGTRGEVPMYDRRCRTIARERALARIAAGEPHVWRMAVPPKAVVMVEDLIRGPVRFDSDTLDDQVLLKSDGFPTYHLANVVDDHLMQISHVIRGEEWLPSTPKHVLLYQFFGWELPQFAHLPLLLNPDRSKMSKRSGDVAVEAYRNKGILPEALINFVALLGWHPQDDREMFTVGDLIREFSLERVGKAGAVFDMTKLKWMNAEYIKAQNDDELIGHIRADLEGLFAANGERRVRYAVQTLRGGAETYADMVQRVRDVFMPLGSPDAEMAAILEDETARQVIAEFETHMAQLDPEVWSDFEKLEALFKTAATDAGQTHGVKGKTLWRALRAALTGQPHGPELAKLVGIWGRDRVLVQLQRAQSGSPDVISDSSNFQDGDQ